ncbi:MAG: aminotransferase class V-fold PLP-dependent enzyme [Bacteriovoracaceae bacterium]|nr:aminotransferase class V-fold PLP-dependent enzyme [Bacteriovoracaceae bacterium]
MKYSVPANIALNDILPNPEILLMGAGPVPTTPEVKAASAIIFSHLGSTMRTIVERVQTMSRYIFQTETTRILGIAGPASAAMEMAMVSLVWPGRKVLVLNLGTFSNRFGEMARGLGGEVKDLYPQPLSCFKAQDVKDALDKEHFDVITLTHGETSCGIMNVELQEIAKIAKSKGVRVVLDAVVTLSCLPVPMDEWGIDVMFTGGQKGVSAIPGISLIAFGEDVFTEILSRKEIISHWCLDVRRAWKFWGNGEYHYTAPVTGILALHEGLRLICLETLEKRFERHLDSSLNFQTQIEKKGLELYAPKNCRLNSVVAIKTPQGVVAKDLIQTMIKNHHVEISGAFGLDIIRVGQMGEQCRPVNTQRVLHALSDSIERLRK